MAKHGWVARAFLGYALVAQSAGAQPTSPPFVGLELENCDEIEPHEVRRVLAAELDTGCVGGETTRVMAIRILCTPPNALIRVIDSDTRALKERVVDLSDAPPESHARLLAIAAAEFALAGWGMSAPPDRAGEPPEASSPKLEASRSLAPPEPTSAETPPEVPPPPTRGGRRAREVRRRELQPTTQRLLPFASGRGFINTPGGLGGGGLRFGQERTFAFSWAADLLFEGGTLDETFVTSTSLGGQVLARLPVAPVTWRAGVGARIGVFRGYPYAEKITMVPWGWPTAATSASVTFNHLVGELAAESGIILLSTANVSPGLTAWWVNCTLGVGAAW